MKSVGFAAWGHNGPFVVDVDREAYLAWLEAVGFDPDDVVSVDDFTMEKMRAEYGVKAHVPSGMDLIAATTIGDWRLGKDEDELSERQKEGPLARQAVPKPERRPGDRIRCAGRPPAPARSRDRQGYLKLLPSRDRGVDLDAIVLVEPERVLFSHYACGGKAVAFHKDGVDRAVENDPVPSFGEDPAPKL